MSGRETKKGKKLIAKWQNWAGIQWTSQDLLAAVGYIMLGGLFYAACYLAIGAPFAYGGGVFTTVIIYIVAQIAGFLFQLVRLPALLGQLLSGMLLVNALPSLVQGLPASWSAGFRACALGTIFLRSGLELDLKVFRRVGPVATRLLLIPGLVEAFTDGGMAIAVFGMPWAYAFTLGFILKAVGPAIVIQTMFELQKGGWGVAKGIPSTVVAAASFDDMVAITGYSLFSNLAIRNPDSSLAWQLVHGPLDIVLGIAAGLVGAIFVSCTKIWNTRMKRVLVVFFTAQGLLFLLYEFSFKAGGALSALVMGLVANMLWAQGRNIPLIKRIPGFLSAGPSEQISHEVERVVGVFWRWVAQPLLFGIIGTMMNFRKQGFEFSYIPKALAVICVGLTVRMPTTFLCMAKAGLTLKERLFVAFAWTPKATVQAALGALPLTSIIEVYGADSPYVEYGDMILTTSIFAILVAAPLGVMLIQFTHKRLLKQMDVVIARSSRAIRTFVSAGTQYNPDDISDAPEGSIRVVPQSMTNGQTDGQTEDLKPEEALRRRMLSESLARRRLAARRRMAAEAAVLATRDGVDDDQTAARATGSSIYARSMAGSISSLGAVRVNSNTAIGTSALASSSLSAPAKAKGGPSGATAGAPESDGGKLATQGSSSSFRQPSQEAGPSRAPSGALQYPMQVPRSASAPSGLPLTAAAAMATAGVGPQGPAGAPGGSRASSRPGSAGGGDAQASGSGVVNTASADAGSSSAVPQQTEITAADEPPESIVAEPEDAMYRLTMQDVLQEGSLTSVDEALARYFAETERLIDMVEGGQLSAEEGHTAAMKLRATLRTVCKSLAEEPVREPDTVLEDSELATTFFRMADRIVLPPESTEQTEQADGQTGQTADRTASIELAQVTVASAG